MLNLGYLALSLKIFVISSFPIFILFSLVLYKAYGRDMVLLNVLIV
jgi:hypothetical protein